MIGRDCTLGGKVVSGLQQSLHLKPVRNSCLVYPPGVPNYVRHGKSFNSQYSVIRIQLLSAISIYLPLQTFTVNEHCDSDLADPYLCNVDDGSGGFKGLSTSRRN